jgi:hypothetical protein
MEITVPIPANGYFWESVKTVEASDFVLRAMPEERPLGARDRRVCLVAGLHLTFMNTPLSLDGVRDFANRYGDLFEFNFPERVHFSYWCTEILAMKTIGDLDAGRIAPRFESLEEIAGKKLRGHVVPRLPKSLGLPAGRWIVSRSEHVAQLDRTVTFEDNRGGNPTTDKREISQVGRQLLAWIVEQRLHKGMDVRVRPHSKPGRKGKPQTGYAIELIPGSLHSFLWYSFILGLKKNTQAKTCAFCQLPFMTGQGGKRSDALYCSDKCKMADHRPPKTKPNRRGKP